MSWIRRLLLIACTLPMFACASVGTHSVVIDPNSEVPARVQEGSELRVELQGFMHEGDRFEGVEVEVDGQEIRVDAYVRHHSGDRADTFEPRKWTTRHTIQDLPPGSYLVTFNTVHVDRTDSSDVIWQQTLEVDPKAMK